MLAATGVVSDVGTYLFVVVLLTILGLIAWGVGTKESDERKGGRR